MAGIANNFASMTDEPVELAEFEAARTKLFEWAVGARFLLSIKQGVSDWALVPFQRLDKWPAIQWKLHNIELIKIHSH
jgi:hypothetical protein